jgi:flagellar hook assembly protein FlgD
MIEPGGPASAVGNVMPAGYILHPNYPNPFNPQTSIRFDLPETARVSLHIYDVAGHLVRTLVANETRKAGQHDESWDGRDRFGGALAAGVYFYRLEVGSSGETRQMTLVK